jgi:hypothetical protein
LRGRYNSKRTSSIENTFYREHILQRTDSIDQLRGRYNSKRFQFFVAAMIIIGFVQDIIEAQIRPEEGSEAEQALLYMDVIVSIFYTLELCCNLAVHSGERVCVVSWYSI